MTIAGLIAIKATVDADSTKQKTVEQINLTSGCLFHRNRFDFDNMVIHDDIEVLTVLDSSSKLVHNIDISDIDNVIVYDRAVNGDITSWLTFPT